jgi:arylsulfatase A-like enzyme
MEASLSSWLINAAAFWLGEILDTATPADAEPLWVLLVALAGMLVLGAAGALLTTLLARALGRARIAHVWLAFLPGAVLLLPRAVFALRLHPAEAMVPLAVCLVLGVALAVAWRRAARATGTPSPAAYAVGSLAFWSIALEAKNIISNVPLTAPAVATNLLVGHVVIAGLAVLGVAMAAAGLRRPGLVPALGAAAALLIAARFVVPPVLLRPGAPAATVAAHGTRPPVILIVMDTARLDHLSVYGYRRDTTPVLAAFAAEAEVFDNAVSTSSWTLPAHASLFTSLYPLRHGADRPHWLRTEDGAGVERPGLPLTPDHLTLAEWLAQNGYDTGGVASNFGYLDPAFGLDQGFAFYDAAPNTPVKPLLLATLHRRVTRLLWAARYWRIYRRAEQVNRTAFAWLDGRSSDALFLFLNYMEPHRDWTAPGLRFDTFAAERDDPPSRFRPGALAPGLREMVDLYDSQLASLDHEIGRLFDELKRLGLYDRALVIVTSDHGESFGEHEVVGHGQSVYDPEVAVPLLIKHPGGRVVGERAERVQVVDLMPTIASVLQLAAPPGLEGQAIGRVTHPILAEFYTDPRAAADVPKGYHAALYEGPLKLHQADGTPDRAFDVEQDPGERRAIEPPPAALAPRRTWLTERRHTLEDTLRARSAPTAPLDPGVERALRALGYVDGPDAP